MSNLVDKYPYRVVTNCIDCMYHDILPDPDPHDSFCSDDVKVQCLINCRLIIVACRPYMVRKECDRPAWCPMDARRWNYG